MKRSDHGGAQEATDVAILARTPDAEAVVRQALEDHEIPETLHGGLVRYLLGGIKPGSFLVSVLENDLREAMMRANPREHFLAIPRLVQFLNNETPAPCHGSPAKVAAWIAERRQPQETP